MIGAIHAPAVWRPHELYLPLIATFALPASPAPEPARWLADRLWRLRAQLGLTPTDDQFR